MINVFVGYDLECPLSYHVCCESIIQNTTQPVRITPVFTDARDGSNSSVYARFLVPHMMGYEDHAIYIDGDTIVEGDLTELWERRSNFYDVSVVKHNYVTKEHVKYRGNPNEDYPRKNWSSVMIFNCKQCTKLTPDFVNTQTGEYLHRFGWTHKVGLLPYEWNWLVEEYPDVEAKLYHFTLGIPLYRNTPIDHIWNKYAECITTTT